MKVNGTRAWDPAQRARSKASLVALALCLCGGNAQSHDTGLAVSVELEPKSGSTVGGKLSIRQLGDAIHIKGEIRGLTPGKHGMHVHTNGNCDSPDGMSAGGNFNPYGARRDGPQVKKERPLGDLGNIEADAKGTATVDMLVDGITIAIIGINSISDRSIVVYSQPDDASEPNGNSGKRVACGYIDQEFAWRN